MSTLTAHFDALISRCAPTLSANHQRQLWHELQQHYTEPHRHYHTLAHITFLLNEWQKYHKKFVNADMVALAIYYHDIIYEPLQTDNEYQSAQFFDNSFMDILSQPQRQSVMRLIEMTAKHSLKTQQIENKTEDILDIKIQPFIADASLFLDMDLAILGMPWAQYEAYAKAVRLEYIQIESNQYQQGRKQVLQRLLAKPYLYFTSSYRQTHEQQARQNMNQELQLLASY